MSTSGALIDVRTIPPRERHARILSAFDGLAAGQHLEIVNDHDPRPLRDHFALMHGDEGFSWNYLEQGPVTWRVAIARQAAPRSSSPCCGACGGGA